MRPTQSLAANLPAPVGRPPAAPARTWLGVAAVAAVCAGPATLAAQVPTQFVGRTPPPFAAEGLRELAIADFDGDGDLDLCGSTGLFSLRKNILLRNDGQERFTDVTATTLPVAAGSSLMTVPFDMEGDGDVDLFVSKQNQPSRLWRNTGAGAFVDASGNLPGNVTNHFHVIAADFDGDGDVDLAAALRFAVPGSQDQLLTNNGSGGFAAAALPVPADTQGLAASDVDGDGDFDLIAGSATGPRLLRNDGNLVFTDATATWFPGLGMAVQNLTVGDIDGDGDPDLVCGCSAPSDFVLRNTGGSFATIATLPTAGSGTKSLVLFDADEDGDLDLVRSLVSAFIPLGFEINDGTGSLAPAPSRLPVTATITAQVFAADIDGDGDRDVLATEELGVVVTNSVLINRQRDLVVGQPVRGQPWAITAWSEPGYASLHHTCRLGIGLTRLTTPLAIPGFGDLWLDLDGGYVAFENIVLANVGAAAFTVPVPNLPHLLGLPLHVQALVEQARHPAHFTADRSVVVQ